MCAQQAQPHWARLPVKERTACLRRAAQRIRERRDELIAWEILEVGKTWREADADLLETIEYLEYYSQCMEELARGKPLLQVPGERNLYRYIPRGLAAVIAPWNFPAAILTGMTSAALVTGNAVVLKPATASSLIAAKIVEMLHEAGVPRAILQYVPGGGQTVGAALVHHPQIQTLLFTGSKAVGLAMIETAGRVLPGQRVVKHVIAEMGGKNAIIVDADADLDAAIQGTRMAIAKLQQKKGLDISFEEAMEEKIFVHVILFLFLSPPHLMIITHLRKKIKTSSYIKPTSSNRIKKPTFKNNF